MGTHSVETGGHPRPHDRTLAEADPHGDFAAARRVGYVERPDELAALDAFALGATDANLMLVTGASGSGKSSLLANWVSRFRAREPSAFILEHYIGVAGSSTSHVDIVRRIILAVRDHNQVQEDLPASSVRMEEDLPLWLGYVHGEDFVLVIDGLDHLEPASAGLTWLPEYLPPRVRLIVSSRDGEQCQRVRARGCAELAVRPLSNADRVAIARRHIDLHNGNLSHEQVHRLTSAPGSANPLFLRTSVDAVRAYDRSHVADERIDYYLAASGIGDLYQRMLERLETEDDPALLRDVLCLVGASRFGLTRDDLVFMTGDPDRLDRVIRRLEFFLMAREGRLSLLHQELRLAVRHRYLSTDELERAAHLRLADYLATLEPGCRVEELAWQLARAGAHERLADALSDLCVFHALFGRDEGLELMGYVLQLGDRFDAGEIYPRAFERRRADGELCTDAATIGNELGEFLQLAGHTAAAVGVLSTVAEFEGIKDGSAPQAAMTHMLLGRARRECGDLSGAAVELETALAIVTASPDVSRRELLRCRDALAELLYYQGAFDLAERFVRESITIARAAFGECSVVTAQLLGDLGGILFELRRFEEAEDALRTSLAMNEELLGPDHSQTAQSLNNLAGVLAHSDRLDEATRLMVRAVEINRRVLGPRNEEFVANLISLGFIRQEAGDLELATHDFEQALAALQSTGRAGSCLATVAMYNLAELRYAANAFADAEVLQREALRIRTELLGPTNRDTISAALGLVYCLWAQGRIDDAEALCRSQIDHAASAGDAGAADLALTQRVLQALLGGCPAPSSRLNRRKR